MSDPPTVKLIKEREGNWNSMRIVSHSSDPWGANSRLLDYPDISIARGLQSVNGYDPCNHSGGFKADYSQANTELFTIPHINGSILHSNL